MPYFVRASSACAGNSAGIADKRTRGGWRK